MEKIDKNKWINRLGTALQGVGTVVGLIGTFPGSGLLAEGIKMGGTIMKERVQGKETKNIQDVLANISEEQGILRKNLDQSLKEAKHSEWEAIKEELMTINDEERLSQNSISMELTSLTSLANKTFDLVTELRFKV